ncbi:hypothetical protein K438DRAFT_2012239 [Mycena galopus ATCC 62051]|nr:hypothetical protein K438DRAFT_2012239 [Mycena galopus ATCC 62051]
MSVDPLSTAFTIFKFIQSCVQSIKTSKAQLGLLSTCTKELLTMLNAEFSKSRLVPEECSKALADLEILLHDIHRFVETEKSSEFLRMLLQKDACLSKIAISSLLNIQAMLAESKEAQARDTEALHTYLSALEKNNAKLLRTLEINQNNTIAMMICIQKQLKNRNIDCAEQQFYTHTLEYLTSRSGTQVKVESWMISSFEVQYQEEIGSGGFGTVYRGTWNRTEVAIKVLCNEVGIRPSHATIRNEIDIWSTLRHPNIVQFLGANTLDDKPFIVMPLLPYNAKDFLQERPTFDPLFILRDISLGLEYLHSRNICHGDLKGINVLVDNSERALLCDFGLARLKVNTTSHTRAVDALQIQGSRNWMAPELLNGSRHRLPSDVYAFSMTLYELYTNEIPLFSVPYADLVDLVGRRRGRPERPEPGEGRPIPQEVWELAKQCWVAHPHKRPTATQIHDAIEHMVSYRPMESQGEPIPNHLSTREENSEDMETRARELATRCWKEDEDFLRKEKHAEWLGSVKPINKAALHHYINFFDFTGLRLDLAFRRLCAKLYLKAETQQIDRILEEFSRRYWECNPNEPYGSSNIIHAVSHSLLLLNTDLHVADLATHMLRTQFVQNTLKVIKMQLQQPATPTTAAAQSSMSRFVHGRVWENDMENLLKDMYNAVKSQEILLPLNISQSSMGSLTPGSSGAKLRKRSQRGSIQGLQSILGQQANSPYSSNSSITGRRKIPILSSATSTDEGIRKAQEDGDGRSECSDKLTGRSICICDGELALLGAPWAKEGMLCRKHYWERVGSRVKDKVWLDVFVVLQKGELNMFTSGHLSSGVSGTFGDGNWRSNAKPVGTIQLAHSLVHSLPSPGYNRQRPYCMALTLVNGGMYFFQAGAKELVNQWVSTCNYWAARTSKEPLAGGVSNMEYGWNRLDELAHGRSHSETPEVSDIMSVRSEQSKRSKFEWREGATTVRGMSSPWGDQTFISDWKPPLPLTVSSPHDEEIQLEVLRRHVASMKMHLKQHNEYREPMAALYQPRSSNAIKAQSNWEKKSQYLLAEIVKYDSYIDSLQTAMSIQRKMLRAFLDS